ncbi:GAF and ANTAR domain-containing protein [Nocardia brasiliensis]|uniref:GAF and ANTAR domain-containing protein n=1 Tax=Nocardia brasiliensis TaxID=37326 RepID=UPI00366E55D6
MTEDTFAVDEFASGLSELTAVLLSTADIEESLGEIAATTSRILPGRPMAGVTLTRGGDVATVASSGAHATVVDEIQYGGGRGPCLEAIQTGQPVSVPDVTEEHRWGNYPAQVLAHGVRSIYSYPLVADGETIGALNLYSTSPRAFDDKARQAIALTASHTGMLLSAAIHNARQAELTEQLRSALASRSLIDQALGILMGQQRCSREKAFQILRRASQDRNIKLATLAAELIRSYTGSEPEQTHFNYPESRNRTDAGRDTSAESVRLTETEDAR